MTEYTVTDVGSPTGMTPGPDGNLWVTRTGRYRLRVRASAGSESVLRTLAFRVVRRR